MPGLTVPGCLPPRLTSNARSGDSILKHLAIYIDRETDFALGPRIEEILLSVVIAIDHLAKPLSGVICPLEKRSHLITAKHLINNHIELPLDVVINGSL